MSNFGRLLLAGALIALAISAIAGFGVPRLDTEAGVELLVDTGSAAYRDQAAYAQAFGGDPIVVEVEAAAGQQLLTPDHMVGLAGMEGKLAPIHGVARVYGPGTLVNTLANTVTQRALDICGQQARDAETKAVTAAKAAGKSAAEQQSAGQAAFDAAAKACAGQLAAQFPNLGLPAVDNPAFYGEVLLEPGGQRVRPFWAWALADPNHAIIQVRMKPGATPADVRTVLDRVDAQSHRKELKGTAVHVTGAPALAVSLADAVQRSLYLLLPLALVAMLLVTLLALRAAIPLRLLAVPLAAVAAGWTAGIAGWAGLPLTPATLAVLPVVLGLTADYVIQAVNRLGEEDPAAPAAARVAAVARALLPATGLAAAATAVAVLTFAVSSVPLVRQFGFFMALGVVCSWLVSVLLGLPCIALLAPRFARSGPRASVFAPTLASTLRVSGRAAVALSIVGLLGWAGLYFNRVETDPAALMPSGSRALAEARHVQQTLGVVGELDLVLTGPDVTTTSAVAWLKSASDRSASADLKELTGLAGFLAAFNNNQPPDASTTQLILQRIPSYFTDAVVAPGKKMARTVFGIPRLTSVETDQDLVHRVNAAAAGAPPGYRAYAAGLSVIAVDALDNLSREQLELNLLATAAVLLVLFAGYRSIRPAALAVLPSIVAAGWATGVLALLRIHASPITVLLAGVVVAFATEFSVLWLARYRRDLATGATPAAAATAATTRVGPAIIASALTLAAGFLVLAASPVPMVRDFGLACGADILLATAAVLVILPPATRRLLSPPP